MCLLLLSHSGFISLAHANLLVSDHVGFAGVVESCHSSNGNGVTKPLAVISAKSLAAQKRGELWMNAIGPKMPLLEDGRIGSLKNALTF